MVVKFDTPNFDNISSCIDLRIVKTNKSQVAQADHPPEMEGQQKISCFFKSSGHTNIVQALPC
jgi:hypothetical protein